MEAEITTNRVYICGVISRPPEFNHEVYGEKFFCFTVSAQRISLTEDKIICTISERLMDAVSLNEGDKVEIRGQYRSYNSMENGRNRLILTLFVREINNTDASLHSNTIELLGNICKKVNYRTTPLGREIADILIAVNRSYSKSDYIPCIAWGRNARFSAGLEVGTKLKLMGRIQSREYIKVTDEGEETRTTYEVSISQMEVIE